jgi:hypothetical protein
LLSKKTAQTVGSINALSGDLAIGTGDTGVRFHDGTNSLFPVNTTTNANVDDSINIGHSTARFKDLYLSGTANFGSLSDGTITITGFADEDNMSSNSATLVPTQQSVKAYVDSQVSSAGGNGISFEDNEKAQFGDGNDLQIYHDGSNSYIRDAGDGDLNLRGDAYVRIQSQTSGTSLAHFRADAEVALYYNNSKKLETTNTGIDVTGTATMDGLTVDSTAGFSYLPVSTAGSVVGTIGTGSSVIFNTPSVNSNFGSGLAIDGSYANDLSSVNIKAFGAKYNSYGSELNLFTSDDTSLLKRLAIASNGDISFYDDTGSTQGLFWDASAENLGIGDTAPQDYLEINGSGRGLGGLTISNSSASHAALSFARSSTATARIYANEPAALHTSGLRFQTSDASGGVPNLVTAMFIDENQNVGIGTTSPDNVLHVQESALSGRGASNGNTSLTLEHSTDTGIQFFSATQAQLRFGDAASTGAGSIIYTHSDNILRFEASSAQRFTIGGTEAMRIDSSGRLLVGTTSVGYSGVDLTVGATTDSQNGVSIQTSTTGIGYLLFGDGTGASAYVGQIAYAHSDNSMQFDTAGTERMRIDSSGNLAIGNTSAAAKLDIRQDSGSAIRCEDGSGAYFVVKQGGLVGIGTPSPDAPLTVHNSSDPEIRFGYSSTQDHKIAWDSSKVFIHADPENANGSSAIGFTVDGSEKARIDSSGLFLVGKTSGDFGTQGSNLVGGGHFVKDGNTALYLNRLSSDGSILALYKDSSLKGSISSYSSGLDIAGSSYGVRFAGSTIFPVTSAGSVSNGAVDLGYSSGRFKDLFLSGVANVAGGIQNTQPTNGFGYLNFGDTDDANIGQIGYDHTNNYMRFQVNNTEKVRIDSSGRLGIGTTSPSLRLHSKDTGNYQLDLDSGGTRWRMGAGWSGYYLNHFLLADTASGIRMVVDTTGNVGIGTASPSNKLDVKGTVGFEATNSTNKWLAYTYTDNTFRLNYNGAGADEITVTSSGNVGIGTSSPTETLHVMSGVSNDTVAIISGSQSDRGLTISTYASDGRTDGGVDLDAYKSFKFTTDGTERASIDSSGNVGIGESSPDGKLHIKGGTATGDASHVLFENTQGSKVFAIGGGASGVTNNNLFFRNVTDNTRPMVITDAGNVGIGTDSPASTLHIGNAGHILLERGGELRSKDTSSAIKTIVRVNGSNELQYGWSSAGAVTFMGGGSYTERMRIHTNGNIGIGTSSPDGNLEVVASSVIDSTSDTVNNVLIGLQSANRPTIVLDTADTTYTNRAWNITNVGAVGSLVIGRHGLDVLNLKNDGKVGIGTSSPETPLHVSTAKSSVTDSVLTLQDTTETFGRMIEFVGQGSTDSRGIIGFQEPQANAPELFIASGGGDASGTGVGLAFWSYVTVDRIIPCDNLGALQDNVIDLGSSNARFDDIYATNGTIQTSDRNDKQDIEEITDAETRVAVACKGLIRKFRWKSAVAEKDDNSDSDETARIHFGIIAQDLQDAFTAEGLDAGDYAMFTSQTWEDSDGVEQTRLGVRYSELLAFIIAAI